MRKSLKLVSLILIGLFLMSFAVGEDVVGTPAPSSGGGESEIVGMVKEFVSQAVEMIGGVISAILEGMGFAGFDDAGEGIALAQFLLMFITVMLIYSVLDFFGMPSKDWGKWMISIAAGLLAFVFISVDMIKSLAGQYTVMAIAINILLPAVIVMAFVWRINMKVYGEGNMSPMVAKLVAILGGGGLIIYLLSAVGKFGDIGKMSIVVNWIVGLTIFITIIVVLFGSSIAGAVSRMKGKEGISRMRGWLAARKIAKLSNLEEEIDTLFKNKNPSAAKTLITEYNALADRVKGVGHYKYKLG